MNELPLRDIHLPAAVSAWPPAMGWWILALVLMLGSIAVLMFFKYQKNKKPKPAYKKIALKAFSTLQKKHQGQPASIELLRDVSALLRRIALSYLPRESVAGLTGEQWIKQLNTLNQNVTFNEETAELLVNAAYRAEANYAADELLKHCEQWVKSLPDMANASPQSEINNGVATNKEVKAQ